MVNGNQYFGGTVSVQTSQNNSLSINVFSTFLQTKAGWKQLMSQKPV